MAGPFDDENLPARMSLGLRRGAAEPFRPMGLDDVLVPVEIRIPLTPELRAHLQAAGNRFDTMAATPRHGTRTHEGRPPAHRQDDDGLAPSPPATDDDGNDAGPVSSLFRSLFGPIDPDQ